MSRSLSLCMYIPLLVTKELKETKEIYEKVVTHLIEEGYAIDVESADSIISGMSEQWFELITEN